MSAAGVRSTKLLPVNEKQYLKGQATDDSVFRIPKQGCQVIHLVWLDSEAKASFSMDQ